MEGYIQHLYLWFTPMNKLGNPSVKLNAVADFFMLLLGVCWFCCVFSSAEKAFLLRLWWCMWVIMMHSGVCHHEPSHCDKCFLLRSSAVVVQLSLTDRLVFRARQFFRPHIQGSDVKLHEIVFASWNIREIFRETFRDTFRDVQKVSKVNVVAQ